MTRNQNAAAVVALAVLALSAFVYITVWSGSDKPAPAADDSAATEPAPAAPLARIPDVFEVPGLASADPQTFSPGTDAKLTELIQQHNANLARIASAKLVGTCTWTTDKRQAGSPRPMTITWDGATGHAAITCGSDHCELDGANVTVRAQTAMKIDAMYLVMFRRFDPKEFTPATPQPDPNQFLAGSPDSGESLLFDSTGRLQQVQIQVDGARVVATYGVPPHAFGEGRPLLSMMVSIHVPAAVFPAAGPDGRNILFVIDPDKSSVTAVAQ